MLYLCELNKVVQVYFDTYIYIPMMKKAAIEWGMRFHTKLHRIISIKHNYKPTCILSVFINCGTVHIAIHFSHNSSEMMKPEQLTDEIET